MGTIAEKLTYLDETREKIRKSINSIGGELTSSDTFRSYSDALDGIYEKFPKVTGTGSDITLEDTMGASIKSELQGDTTQEGTPTPSSPVAVETVTGEQNITTWGKNLFNDTLEVGTINSSGNNASSTTNSRTTNYTTANSNTIYTISSNANCSIAIRYYDSNKTFLSSGTTAQTPNTFTTPENTAYLRFVFVDTIDTTAKVQLEKGSTASEYEVYKEQSYEINLGNIELCKIGTYQDRIYKDNGTWYLEKQIGKVVLDGSESFETQSIKTNTTAYSLLGNIGYKATGSDSINAFINYFKGNTNGYNIDEECFWFNGNGYLRLRISNTIASTVANFKTWLSTHNTTVYYILNTPTYTEITDTELKTQLEEFDDAQSYEGQTNINVDGILPTILNVKALENIFN